MKIEFRFKRGLAFLIASAVLIATACSDDASDDPGNGQGDAANDGHPGDAASNSDGSSIVEDPDTGPKTCGNDEVIPKQTTCNECLSTKCCDTVKACQEDTECLAFFTCMKTCDAGNSCQGTCASGKKAGSLQLFQAMAICAGQQCGDGGISEGCPL